MQSPSEQFLITFIGEYCELLTQFRSTDIEAVTTYQVFLLDVDDDYYYVGEQAEEISAAIRRDTVFSIEIVKPKSKALQLLEGFSVSDKEEN